MTLLNKPTLFKDPKYKNILLFDIETAPNLAYVWGKYEQDVISFKEHWYMLCFAYKWLGEKKTYVMSLPDFKLYQKDKSDDLELVKALWELFNKADIIIAHNGDDFDIKKTNARFLQHGLEPPEPYRTIDTKKLAKSKFKFDSNKLDDLGEYLKVGRKINTGGFGLWLGCMSGDKKSWKQMCDYNIQDVILLEKVYLKLRAWAGNHPNMNILMNTNHNCSKCGSEHTQKRGGHYNNSGIRQKYQCKNCGAWSIGEVIRKFKAIK